MSASARAPETIPPTTYDFAIIGGGVLGLSVALGLALRDLSVIVLDGTDTDKRASRANFGLVWVQSKGDGCPAYQAWTRRSAGLWPRLAEFLREETEVDVSFRQNGGMHVCTSESEMAARVALMERLSAADPEFNFDIFDRQSVREAMGLEPGANVVGASYCPDDGTADPLSLLLALRVALLRFGTIRTDARVGRIVADGDRYCMETPQGAVHAARVVIAAGLDTTRLAHQVGVSAPIRPVRGQVLVTERLPPMLRLPTTTLQQTGQGTILIGDSHEEVGMDDGQTLAAMTKMAHRAASAFPALGDVRVLRAWGGLRIMPRDGLPIYGESPTMPGVFVCAVHSGLTLAAVHAGPLADWMAGAGPPPDPAFSPERFRV